MFPLVWSRWNRLPDLPLCRHGCIADSHCNTQACAYTYTWESYVNPQSAHATRNPPSALIHKVSIVILKTNEAVVGAGVVFGVR